MVAARKKRGEDTRAEGLWLKEPTVLLVLGDNSLHQGRNMKLPDFKEIKYP